MERLHAPLEPEKTPVALEKTSSDVCFSSNGRTVRRISVD